jgi:hypothetical protein
MADVPVHTSRAAKGEPGLPGYEPGDPGVAVARTWIDVPGSELHGFWVDGQDHANQVWRDHHGRDYETPAE